MIIGPPGPTGVIDSALLLSGWMIGEGSGARNTSPDADPRLTAIRGGSRLGSETKWSSLVGCCSGMLSTGGTGASRATANWYAIGLRPAIRIVTLTRSPCVSGRRRTKLAPRRPLYARNAPLTSPLAEPTTRTESIRLGDTPRMLICVSGEASGVPGSGEIATGGTGFAAGATGVEEKLWTLAPAVAAAPAGTTESRGGDHSLQ